MFFLHNFFNFQPQTNYQKYINLINKSDIILDSLDWYGLNTSLDALSLDKPIVTLPSSLMRGRHTHGMLKILDIEATIAGSKEEYVEIAGKLANDISFRASIINKMMKHKNVFGQNVRNCFVISA